MAASLLRWLCLCCSLLLLLTGCVAAVKERNRIKINTQQPPSLLHPDVGGAAAAAASPPSQSVPALSLKRPAAPVSPPPSLPSSLPAASSSALQTLASRCYHHLAAAAQPHHQSLYTFCPYANVTQTLLVWGVRANAAVLGSAPPSLSTQRSSRGIGSADVAPTAVLRSACLRVWEGWAAEPSQLVQSFTDGDYCSAGGELRSRQTRVTITAQLQCLRPLSRALRLTLSCAVLLCPQLHIRCSPQAEDAVISAVVELRRCEYTAWLYTAAACELLPPSPFPPSLSSSPAASSAVNQEQQEDDLGAFRLRRASSLSQCIQLLHAAAVAAEEAEMWRQEEAGWDAAGAGQAGRTPSTSATGDDSAAAVCAERWGRVRKALLQVEPETEAARAPVPDSEQQQKGGQGRSEAEKRRSGRRIEY